ncbi:1-acyl-sn-glycerol-3-phosphate acyltransferase [Streptomyces sp. WMMB 322]|uniref:lysophospholipid acyltransferase family protein n=1 Tax=Streptomyces sp. WMMB 322 TaxID=1286821 RepID=UPI000823C879|nr:lysophospholipid acyltransferase family protein [Streptomyces sp. WMMB 322]SCK45861.1 1-acyl-sn-glycerol-3-phosphate acyltransferases [Streptomyces sp. WMMB 322]
MNPWAIASPCSLRCLTLPTGNDPAGARSGTVSAASVLRRYASLAATLGSALAAGTRIAEPAVLQRQARSVLAALGIGLEATGPLRVPGTATGTLIVANHVSWLDVVAVLALEPVPLIAKQEVAGWPVVGPLARRTGSRFIDRDAPRELPRFVDELTAYLRDGGSVAVFPQATTWCTAPGGPFRRATFQAAVGAAAPVRPTAVDYAQGGTRSVAAAYVGGDTLASSLHRVAATGALSLRLRPCRPLWPHGHDRRSLAAAAHAAVSDAVGVPAGVPRTGVPPAQPTEARPDAAASPHARAPA